MSKWLFLPPVAFLIILAVSILLSKILSLVSFKVKNKTEESRKAYACGEDIEQHGIQMDYSQFFPFAFFFTILHVVALMVATVPTEAAGSFFIAFIYIIGAITGLLILFRR